MLLILHLSNTTHIYYRFSAHLSIFQIREVNLNCSWIWKCRVSRNNVWRFRSMSEIVSHVDLPHKNAHFATSWHVFDTNIRWIYQHCCYIHLAHFELDEFLWKLCNCFSILLIWLPYPSVALQIKRRRKILSHFYPL